VANNFYGENSNLKGQKKMSNPNQRKTSDTSFPEKTANWPGLPGSEQKRDRSGGVKKVKTYASKKGL
jgi:hypothetical protein